MSPIYAAQDKIREHLENWPQFSGTIHFLSRHEGQLLNDIAEGKSKGVGLACFVYPPVPITIKPNLPGPQWDRAQVRVSWFEDFDRNHAAPMHGDEAAILTHSALHHRQLGELNSPLGTIFSQADEPLTWQLTRGGLEHWDCFFDTQIAMDCIT